MLSALRVAVRRTDFAGGLLCAVLGGLALYLLGGMRLGTLAAMGPAFFPTWLARTLVFLGAFIALRALASGSAIAIPAKAIRPALMICGSIVVYALLLPWIGFFLSCAAVLLLGSLSSRNFRFLEALIVAVVGAAAASLLFIYALNLNIAMWPSWMV